MWGRRFHGNSYIGAVELAQMQADKQLEKQNMVDFAKYRKEAAERLKAEQGNASTQRHVSTRAKTHLELLEELPEQDLNDWEAGFCKSCTAYLKAHINNKLSPKQVWCINKMVEKYNLDPDTEEALVPVASHVNKVVNKTIDSIDEDDIPF